MKRTYETQFEIDNFKALKIARKLFDDFFGKKGFFKDKAMPKHYRQKY
jgi:hypothetical protein